MKEIKLWTRFEYQLEYNFKGNANLEVELFGIFTNGHVKVRVRGFYAGLNKFVIRFNPQILGQWRLTTASNVEQLDNQSDIFICTPAIENATGRVIVNDSRHFSYQNGSPYYPFGTTAYVWNHQSEGLQIETLKSLKKAPFNKIRMCVFPKYYDYNIKDPEMFPYKGMPSSPAPEKFEFEAWQVKETGFDFACFNHDFFDKLEKQIDSLAEMGIEVDLILFHPYDRWGFSVMGEEFDHLYLEYIVARLASFNNIWWSLANEYDLLNKSISEWDSLGQKILEEDPYQHLMSNHNWYNPPIHFDNVSNWYPHQRPWITHLSVQNDKMFNIPKWLKEYNKPFINDECRYEGNLNHGWGNLSAKSMVKQFWEAVCRGGYATHGETYLSENGIVWWSHGGTLIGDSVSRIDFLRKIVESNELTLVPTAYDSSHWETSISVAENGKLLIYLGGDSQPSFKTFEFLNESANYHLTLIDTWEMTELKVDTIVNQKSKIKLPSKTGIALLLTPLV